MALLSIAQDYVNGQVFHESAQADGDKIDNIQYWVNVELIAAFALYAGSLVPKAIISSFLFGSIPGKVVGLSVSLVATAVFLHGTTHFIALNYPNAFAKFTSCTSFTDIFHLTASMAQFTNINSTTITRFQIKGLLND